MSQPFVKFTIQTRSRSRQEEVGSQPATSDEPEYVVEDLGELAQQLDVASSGGLSESGSISLSTSLVSQEDVDVNVRERRKTSISSQVSRVNEDLPEGPTMAEGRSPVITPAKFRGACDESVEDYLKTFERAAKANGWDEAKKIVLIPCFLEGAALKWYENLEASLGNVITWEEVKNGMKDAFQTVAWDEQIEFKLRMRMQAEDEPVESYVQDVISLCGKVDPEMPERSKIRHVLRGLSPSLLEKVMVLENATLEDLLKNIRKIQTARYMAGQRVDHLLGVAPRRIPPAPVASTSGNSTARLESQLESLASEFSKLKVRLLGERHPTSGGAAVDETRRHPAMGTYGRRGGRPWRSRGGRTSDGRVICYQCNRVGHFAINCRSTRAPQPGNEDEERQE